MTDNRDNEPRGVVLSFDRARAGEVRLHGYDPDWQLNEGEVVFVHLSEKGYRAAKNICEEVADDREADHPWGPHLRAHKHVFLDIAAPPKDASQPGVRELVREATEPLRECVIYLWPPAHENFGPYRALSSSILSVPGGYLFSPSKTFPDGWTLHDPVPKSKMKNSAEEVPLSWNDLEGTFLLSSQLVHVQVEGRKKKVFLLPAAYRNLIFVDDPKYRTPYTQVLACSVMLFSNTPRRLLPPAQLRRRRSGFHRRTGRSPERRLSGTRHPLRGGSGSHED